MKIRKLFPDLAIVVFLPALLALALLTRCGSSSSAKSTLSALVPGLALTSPTAPMSATLSRTAAPAAGAVESMAQLKKDLKTILASTSKLQCFTSVSFTTLPPVTSCYGPTLVYQNHPGGTPTTPTPPGCPSGTGTFCLPGGDLGIWAATESSGEACASAEMNSLVADVSGAVNNAIKFMAGLACIAQLNNQTLPAAGTSVDVAADTKANIAGSAVTTATIAQEASGGAGTSPIYKITFQGTIATYPVSITLRHSPNANGADSKGRLYGTIGVDATSTRGFSVVYDSTGGADTFVSRSAITPTAAGTTGLFDTNGNYLYTTFLAQGAAGPANRNARYLLAKVDDTTSLGSVYFAWQAGGMDAKSRIFNATTTAGTSGAADTGYAYFGFGDPISSTSTLGTIKGMCCNWTGPGATCDMPGSGYDQSLAQNQVIARDSSTGLFKPTASSITYAPTNSCNYTAGTFKYATIAGWGADGSAVTPASVTNNLGAMTAVGTIPALTEPTF